MINQYTESPNNSEYSRQDYLSGIHALIDDGFADLPFKKNLSPLELALGAPLDREISSPCTVSQEYIGKDDLCEIYRLRFVPLPKIPFYCLLFVPHKAAVPSPIVVAAHGLLGTPELMYGMHGKNGYSNLIARILKKGACVLAPAFLLWNCGESPAKPCYATKYSRVEIDKSLKELGGSITSLEVFFLLRALDSLSHLRFLDTSKISVCGMSYGAFITLRAMALSDSIKSGYFMSCVNGGTDERWPEWAFRTPYKTLRDFELLSLCAPRPVYVEVGRFDDIFPVADAEREANLAQSFYKSQNCESNFCFSVWDGGHIVNPADDGVEFIFRQISES